MFAIIKFAGHQYKVQQGDKLVVNRLEEAAGKKVVVKEVLMTFAEDEKDVKVGAPYVEGASVELKVLADDRKGEKVRVFKMNAKKRYMRNKGHRQAETVVEVVKIAA